MKRDAQDLGLRRAYGPARDDRRRRSLLRDCASRCAKVGLFGWLLSLPVSCSSSPSPMAGDPPGPSGDAGPATDGGISPPDGATPSDAAMRPTIDVDVPTPTDDEEATRRLWEKLNEAKSATAENLGSRYPATFVDSLGYDPTVAAGMDRIQASSLRLNAAELERLARYGFVITDGNQFPAFPYGYRTIYADHLPLYISVDSILEAVHRSYDEILTSVETFSLVPTVTSLLDGMNVALVAMPDDETKRHLDLYLSVARSLLAGSDRPPAAGGDANTFAAIMSAVRSASGVVRVSLFGSTREEDFSQYVPRGHYTGSDVLKRYFLAMMWLGRTDFRLLETQPNGTRVLNRPQVEATFALHELLDEARMKSYQSVDDTIRMFVGEQDYLTIDQLGRLAQNLGITRRADLAALSDEQLALGLGKTTFGQQRIASHIAINDGATATLPLSLSFAFFGQRYVVDSHVFSRVVYDRLPDRAGLPRRMMPDPLDVAFAALGNNQAGALLGSELKRYQYASELAMMRVISEEHGSNYWQSNLYNLWMSSLRALSPATDLRTNATSGLFTVARTEAWGRRVLNAQLASWAELRHDTLLYAKQSYTGFPICEFPDAYVDPYPRFFAAIESLAVRGQELVARLAFAPNTVQQRIDTYFAGLGSAAGLLRQMAETELAGAQLTAEQLAFVNQAVALQDAGCTRAIVGSTGWYAKLFYTNTSSVERDPVIADVHTQPADEAGNLVGRILHVGTGDPRQMVVTTDTCGGPRAYVGLASAYFQRVTEGFTRLTDEDWATSISAAAPPDVPWMADLVVR